MSQDASARLSLPYLLAGQLQKHVTLNEALTRLDLLVQTTVQSRTETAPAANVSDGALYIVPEAASVDDWAGFAAGDLVRLELDHWLKQSPIEGMLALVLDEAVQVSWLGGEWVPVGGASELDELHNLARLGLGTTADANNPFAAKLNKALWSALETGSGGDGDLRFTFNKQSAARVLSLLFQSDWGGRAELGLIGDDDLRLKVSADGGTWHDALVVERASGAVSFAKGATRRETSAVTANGSWTVPAWARWVEVRCIAGGGGGGAGRGGSSGTMSGGGGGGAGGMATALWPGSSLGASLSLTVGAGGAGGVASAGEFGGNSQVEAGSQLVLRAYGGHGGAVGTETEAAGGYGGSGHQPSNNGGRAAVGSSGAGGDAFACPIGPGGGGAGGGVTNGNGVHSGGAGGDGGVLLAAVAGGAASSGLGLNGASASNLALNWSGGGGSGGGGASGSAGHDGGAGGLYGAGGGGGGGGRSTGGKGGAGGAGIIIITAVG